MNFNFLWNLSGSGVHLCVLIFSRNVDIFKAITNEYKQDSALWYGENFQNGCSWCGIDYYLPTRSTPPFSFQISPISTNAYCVAIQCALRSFPIGTTTVSQKCKRGIPGNIFVFLRYNMAHLNHTAHILCNNRKNEIVYQFMLPHPFYTKPSLFVTALQDIFAKNTEPHPMKSEVLQSFRTIYKRPQFLIIL